jgi:hypothetical protein
MVWHMEKTVIVPTAGMPCTINVGSDSYAAQVVRIMSPKKIRVAYGYVLEKVPESDGEEWSLRKDGRWRPKGTSFNSGYSLSLGVAVDHRDPSF